MGISFGPGARIAGFRVAVFRDALRGYSRTRGPCSVVDHARLFAHRRDGAIVHEEMIDRGLIGREDGRVTAAGDALLGARVVARTPLARASEVLDAFLDRVDASNANPGVVGRVDQVWLFGSMLREEADVGDIDLAIVRSTPERFGDLQARVEQATTLLKAHPDAPRNWRWDWDKVDWLWNRAVFGRRRHRLLRGAREGVDDLIAVATPCRLIYDRERGGRVDDPVLPRHPDSTGRADTVDAPPVPPDLSPAPLRPMDARWLAGHHPSGRILPHDVFRGWTDDCVRLFRRGPRDLYVRVGGDVRSARAFVEPSERSASDDADGRAVVFLEGGRAAARTRVALRRRIEERPGAVAMEVIVSDVDGRRGRLDAAIIDDLVATIALVVAVDAERAIRRLGERDGPARLSIAFEVENSASKTEARLRDGVVDALTRRLVAIEPAGVVASVAISIA